jgi:hypothetical protein
MPINKNQIRLLPIVALWFSLFVCLYSITTLNGSEILLAAEQRKYEIPQVWKYYFVAVLEMQNHVAETASVLFGVNALDRQYHALHEYIQQIHNLVEVLRLAGVPLESLSPEIQSTYKEAFSLYHAYSEETTRNMQTVVRISVDLYVAMRRDATTELAWRSAEMMKLDKRLYEQLVEVKTLRHWVMDTCQQLEAKCLEINPEFPREQLLFKPKT